MTTMAAAARKSLPMTARDLAALARLRQSGPHRDALSVLAGEEVGSTPSEAFLIHSVWAAGLRAVEQRLEDAGYAEMAAVRGDSTDRSVARRRRPEWADEA